MLTESGKFQLQMCSQCSISAYITVYVCIYKYNNKQQYNKLCLEDGRSDYTCEGRRLNTWWLCSKVHAKRIQSVLSFCTWEIKTKPSTFTTPFPVLSPSSSILLSSFTMLAPVSFMPSYLTLSSILQLFCLFWVMPDNDLSCKLLRVNANLFMCVYTCVYFLHPNPPTISADHLLTAFFLLPLFVSSFSFGTLPLQEAEKTVGMSYVIVR